MTNTPLAALCPQWLRDRANLLRSKAHEVEHAYNGDAIAPWLVHGNTVGEWRIEG